MSDLEHGDDLRDDEENQSWVDRFVLVFLRESSLWPILFVIVGHIVVFAAPVLILAVRERRVSAMAALLLLGVMSFNIVRFDVGREGRPASLSKLVAITWAIVFAVAWISHRTGIF